jgi:hypothetical protein
MVFGTWLPTSHSQPTKTGLHSVLLMYEDGTIQKTEWYYDEGQQDWIPDLPPEARRWYLPDQESIFLQKVITRIGKILESVPSESWPDSLSPPEDPMVFVCLDAIHKAKAVISNYTFMNFDEL